jgi:hypothetical protein
MSYERTAMSEPAINIIPAETLSPFLPGTKIQYAWDSTSLGYLKGCPRLYYYMMIEGWSPKGEGIHLRFGIEYHTALQEYDIYRSVGMEHADALHEVVKELLIRTVDFNPSEDQYGSAAKYKSRQNLLRTVIWYLDKYPSEKDTHKTYILEDGRPAVELSFRLELEWGPKAPTYDGVEISPAQPYILSGHLDRVVSFADDLYFLDHKTTKSQPGDFYFSQYDPDNQMTLYSLAAKVVLNTPVKGGIIDAAQILIDGSRFVRGFTFRSEDRIQEWLLDLRILLDHNEGYAADDYWPQNDKFCGTYRSEESGSIGCPFREVCGKSPRMREPFLKSKFNKLEENERWNPLKPR